MAAPILIWAPGKIALFPQENLYVHKIPRFRGGGILVFFEGGGGCRFYSYGSEDFSDRNPRRTNFWGRARTFRLRGRPPPHRAVSGPKNQKNPRAHKNKSALPPPPQNPKSPPQKKRGILWTWRFSCRKKAFFQVSIKFSQPCPAPEMRTKYFTDTRIFLKKLTVCKLGAL